MGTITRREFLAALGVAAGGCALAYTPEVGLKAFREAWGEDWVEVPQGPERWVPALCGQCSGGCGIRVRLIGDRPVKIDGNPLHPVNRGRLCPRGQAGLSALNDPDRIRGPLKRIGERGAGKWQEISWEEAIQLVVGRLKEIRSKGAPHTLALMNGDSDSLMKPLWERFLIQFGSPNYIPLPSGWEEGPQEAFYLMQGLREGVVYDMEMANTIVSFGTDLLQSFRSPVQVMKAFGYMRRGRGVRGRVLQVEPRYSITAAKADEWIPVNPGTEGVLALGMGHFIVKEGLYDKDFVENHTFGFEDGPAPAGGSRIGYKTLVLQNYSPAVVAEMTGAPVETIVRLAKEFATRSPALAIGTRGDIYQQMAVHALNALVGNIDQPGGVLAVKNPPALDLPAAPVDGTAQKGRRMPPIASGDPGEFPLATSTLSRFPERVLRGMPYEISTLFLYQGNPRFTHGHLKDFSQTLDKIPFVASFSPYMDETTQHADLVLPDHTFLEKWQGNLTYTFQGFPVVGISQPVTAPLYHTRNTADVVMEIARGMGKPLAQAFPWKDSKELLVDTLKKVYALNQGDLFAPEFEEALLRELARRGWRAPAYKSFEEFWQGVQEKGGWWNPVYSFEEWERVLQTPSRKFEFYSQILKSRMESHGRPAKNRAAAQAGPEEKGDRRFLPHGDSSRKASADREKDYPFHLNVFQPLIFAGSLHANQPFLQDISSFYTRQRWSSWVEINPKTAEKLAIREGDWVWVESSTGKLKFKARLTPGAIPQVVNIPLGLGHQASGRWAKGVGENPGRILIDRPEPFTGEPLIHQTRVKVYKA